jgi:hypothetical protein
MACRRQYLRPLLRGLSPWQAAHEKIFRAMDVDKDGTITFEEIMNLHARQAETTGWSEPTQVEQAVPRGGDPL